MKRLWTIIGVRDVPRSFRWYQTLLGLAPGAPAHPDFGQLLDADGTVLLCLHEWGVEDHPTITSPDAATPGNGLLLFFRVDDFDAALVRARAGGTPPEEASRLGASGVLVLVLDLVLDIDLVLERVFVGGRRSRSCARSGDSLSEQRP